MSTTTSTALPSSLPPELNRDVSGRATPDGHSLFRGMLIRLRSRPDKMAMILFGAVFGVRELLTPYKAAPVLVFCALLFLLPLLPTLMTWLRLKKVPHEKRVVTFTVGVHGFAIENHLETLRRAWEATLDAREHRDYFVINLSRDLGILIPKRAFPDPKDLAVVRYWIQSGPPRRTWYSPDVITALRWVMVLLVAFGILLVGFVDVDR